MKRTIVEKLANQYARLKQQEEPPKHDQAYEFKQHVDGFIEGFKRSSLLLDEVVNDFIISDFLQGAIDIGEDV